MNQIVLSLRSWCAGLYNRSVRLAHRTDNPYATHIPILVGIATAFAPSTLVEFGSGTLSTLSFLNRVAFPSLERVDSFENNYDWYTQIKELLPVDSLVKLNLVQGPISDCVRRANPAHADVLFIDDSPTAKGRVPTVRAVAKQCGSEPLVIMHDYELWRLRLATRSFKHRVSFDAYNPQTVVMWNRHPERKEIVEEVKHVIDRHAFGIALTDVVAWRTAFAKELGNAHSDMHTASMSAHGK